MRPNETPEYVPSLDELSRLLWRHFMGGNDTMSDEQIDGILNPRPLLCTRFAFLQMATIANHVTDTSRYVSQWDEIDRCLLQMRELQVNYTKQLAQSQYSMSVCVMRYSTDFRPLGPPVLHLRSWHRLLCNKDLDLFDSAPRREDLIVTELACPTHAEVNTRITARGNRN